MAVPVLAASGTGAATLTTTLAVPYPASVGTGHLLLMHILVRDVTSGAPTTPGSWSLLHSDAFSSFDQYTYSLIAAGGETGNLDVTVITDGAGGVFGRMYRFTGDDVDWQFEDPDVLSGTTSPVLMPDVTTTAANRLCISLTAVSDNNIADSATGETGGDWIEAVAEFADATGLDGMLVLQTADMAAAGTISGGSYGIGANDPWVNRAFAIFTSAGAPPPVDVLFAQAIM